MTSTMVCMFVAGSMTLGACATASSDAAALTPDQMRAELASIERQLDAIDVVVREDTFRADAQARAAAFAAGSFGGFAVSRVYEQSVQEPYERQTVNSRRQLGKAEQLVRRREQLQAQLAKFDAANG